MSAQKCATCGKSAYPLESVTAIGNTYHKICFKCDVCGISLSIKNYKGLAGKIYCFTHTPVERSSTGSDSVATKTALSAPKKVAEGLGNAQKGTGDQAIGVGLDSLSTKAALSAPKVTAEGLGNVQKGSGDQAIGVGLDSISTKAALSAPKATAEGLGTVQKGSGDQAVGVGLDSIETRNALSAPKAAAEGLGTVHKGHATTAPTAVDNE
jgi:hypothetical protein